MSSAIPVALVADHAKLCRLSFDGSVLSKAELTDKLRPAAHVSYCDSPHGVFVTDGNSLLRYKDAGLLVAADKTYLITGDLEAVREVAPFGAAFDSWCKGPDGQLYWFSDRGLAKASEDCVVQALPWWFSVF